MTPNTRNEFVCLGLERRIEESAVFNIDLSAGGRDAPNRQ
jgi:hypothetical protein